jgi:hypothetical protein
VLKLLKFFYDISIPEHHFFSAIVSFHDMSSALVLMELCREKGVIEPFETMSDLPTKANWTVFIGDA